jgi:hypothetical protein
MPVIAVDEFAFDGFGSEFLVLITATITNPRFAPKRDYLKLAAFFAFKKIKALADFTAVNDFAHFMVNHGTDGVSLNEFIPFILKYPLHADHKTIISNKPAFTNGAQPRFGFYANQAIPGA